MLAQHLLGVEVPVFFDLVLHVGTLLVVFVFFRHRIGRILVALWGSWRVPSWRAWLADVDRRLAFAVVVGTAVTGVLALTFEERLLGFYEQPRWVGAFMVAMGFVLVLSWRLPWRHSLVGWREGLVVGLAQALAVLPGISRSGSTIVASQARGIDPQEAVEFSFLLSIPAIAGAAILQADGAALAAARANALAYGAGTLAAVIVGYGALALLAVMVRKRALHYFAPYLLVVGAWAMWWFA